MKVLRCGFSTSNAVPLAEGLRALRVVGWLVSDRYGVSVGIERGEIVVVLHFMFVGCQEVLEPVSYCRSDACLG